jgi:hypothetical protein
LVKTGGAEEEEEEEETICSACSMMALSSHLVSDALDRDTHSHFLDQ